MKAIEAAANAKFTEDNIKTIQGQLDLWTAQAENWKGQRENALKQIEAQVEQWNKENKFKEKKLNLKVQEHILFKEFDKLVAEINGVNLDNDQKQLSKTHCKKA